MPSHDRDTSKQGSVTQDQRQNGFAVGESLVNEEVEMRGVESSATSGGNASGSECTHDDSRCEQSAASNSSGISEGSGSVRSLQRHRILVIDDSQAAAYMLARLLENYGQEVVVAHDGFAGLAMLTSTLPDIVICDIGMPGMDGYVLAREASKLRHRTDFRLVALTGYGQQEDRNRALEAGFDDHVVKPIQASDLESILLNMQSTVEGRVRINRR